MVGWRVTLWAAIVVAALYFLFLVRSILLPFVLAMVISALISPTIKKLRMRGYSRGMAIGLVFSAFLLVVVAVGVVLVPLASNQVGTFRTKVDELTASLGAESPNDNFFLRWNPALEYSDQGMAGQVDRSLRQLRPTLERFGLPSTRRAIVDQYVVPYKKDFAANLQSFFGGFLGFVSGFASQFLMLLFTPLFVLLMVLDMDRFKRRLAGMIPPSIRAQTIELADDIGDVFFSYLRGVTIVVLYYVMVASVILTLLGAPYSILLALLFSLIYLVPIVGQAANAIILFSITVASGKVSGLFFAVDSPVIFALIITGVFAGCMVIFDQLFYARLVGNAVGLHPLVSFFVVFAGGALFGAKGMLFAFPIAGSVKVILDRLLKFTTKPTEDLRLPSVPLRHRPAG